MHRHHGRFRDRRWLYVTHVALIKARSPEAIRGVFGSTTAPSSPAASFWFGAWTPGQTPTRHLRLAIESSWLNKELSDGGHFFELRKMDFNQVFSVQPKSIGDRESVADSRDPALAPRPAVRLGNRHVPRYLVEVSGLPNRILLPSSYEQRWRDTHAHLRAPKGDITEPMKSATITRLMAATFRRRGHVQASYRPVVGHLAGLRRAGRRSAARLSTVR